MTCHYVSIFTQVTLWLKTSSNFWLFFCWLLLFIHPSTDPYVHWRIHLIIHPEGSPSFSISSLFPLSLSPPSSHQSIHLCTPALPLLPSKCQSLSCQSASLHVDRASGVIWLKVNRCKRTHSLFATLPICLSPLYLLDPLPHPHSSSLASF